MGLEIRTGPKGTSALWNGRQLTSAYDPDREARRWADGLGAAPGTLVFVAGDPLGLASKALSEAGVRAVALLPGAASRGYAASVTSWAPEDGSLRDFLEATLDQWGPDAVSWQVWPAFERHAAEVSLSWARTFRDVYRTSQGSWLTQSRFGPRFWTNAVRNATDWSEPVALVPGTRPVVIAASGPSLDDALGLLERYRDRFDLWALPSSFEVLLTRGMPPDAAIATDAGYHARAHLHRLAGTRIPVIAALSSAADPTLGNRPALFFSQGLDIERSLLGALVPGYGEVPSRGTVAATAIDLALAATSGPVLVAGLDLAFRGLRAHAYPHTNDRELLAAQTRTTSYETLLAEALYRQAPIQAEGAQTSSALLTYAGWFKSHPGFARPVYRIAPSALRWNCMSEVTAEQAGELLEGGRAITWREPPGWPSREKRLAAVRGALDRLAERVAAADDAWVASTARTGAPRAQASDWQSRRLGKPPTEARAALLALVQQLRTR